MSVSRHDKEQNKCQGNKYIFVNIKMGVHNTSPLKEKEIFYKKISFTNVP